MTYGYTGNILRVDLTKSMIKVEKPNIEFYRKYMGGRALALYYLVREVEGKMSPFDPSNEVIFATSVVTGVPFPGNSRFTVAAKSPLTESYGESEAGGFWGPELKFAGFDAVIVKGCSEIPVFIWIHESEVKIENGKILWGKDTAETTEIIREKYGDRRIRVACIGQAGENLVRYASVHNDLKHVNGRTGMGAVMGSKKLKAIAVRGRERITVNDPQTIREKARWFNENFKNNPTNLMHFQIGTSGVVLPLNALGILPTRNFQEGAFEKASEISGEKMNQEMVVGRESCYACPVGCKKRVKLEGEISVDPKYGAPEYETIAAFGSNCGISDLKIIAKANELCNKYGLDTISTGNAIAFAMECCEKGIVTEKEVGRACLKFGDGSGMLKMIEDIVFRKNFGDLLAEGVSRASKRIGKGAEEIAMHVKGEECPMHEPRGKYGVGLGYVVGTKGACHIEAEHDIPFIARDSEYLKSVASLGIQEPLDATDISLDKVRLFIYLQKLWGLYMVLDLCIFVGPPGRTFRMKDIVEIIRAATGWDTSLFELMKAGERGITLARAFNIKCGKTYKDDSLPLRFFTPLKKGLHQTTGIPKDKFNKSIKAYYSLMGWNERAIPREEKLVELGIGWVNKYLKPYLNDGLAQREPKDFRPT